eukprot:480218-Pelagomonas_calceolata.AAC.2
MYSRTQTHTHTHTHTHTPGQEGVPREAVLALLRGCLWRQLMASSHHKPIWGVVRPHPNQAVLDADREGCDARSRGRGHGVVQGRRGLWGQP